MTESNGAVVGAITGDTIATLCATEERKDRAGGEGWSTIGELAREFGVTLRALRFYENKGMIAPHREGLARLYSPAERNRLSVILTGKRLRFTLDEIRRMVAAHDGRNGRLDLGRDKCQEQIALLEDQKRSIEAALTELRHIQATLATDAAPPARIAC